MAGQPDRGGPWGGTGVAWSIVGTLLSGILAWGGIGYLADRWVGTDGVFLPIGMVLGVGVSLYVIIVRYGRNEPKT